ncbi:AraC-type DNA-binding protein [Amycolatopsis arida]|uniref:AraC-type DNA-binding protein n=1 Tax=Amycolatopsis arida TaxID=587909 RepID=A0A1I5MIY9_9PSEU|nr:AraC family transcriptional regulator [Amycolatopsis arida]TDX94113.1 AraC-like DNA-binding protein [Amycolatopsis arida]SFP09574.1 AraC-type DNA-binding protein [Amycolatopsis arida]
MQLPVQQVIKAMRERYFDPITLEELAAEVFVSQFHFSRIFAKATGVTPGRYLTAIRMFEAKRLLLTTSLTVSDIVCSIGYSSVGTFTTRFTRAVGMTPTQYRDPAVGELLLALAHDFFRLPSLEALRNAGKSCTSRPHPGSTTITGVLELPPAVCPAHVLVGVFPERIPQCGPVAFTALPYTGSTRMTIPNVPPGRWHVIAAAERADGLPGRPVYLGTTRHQVTVVRGRPVHIHLRLRELQPTDPPIAITLATQTSSDSGRLNVPRRPALRIAA